MPDDDRSQMDRERGIVDKIERPQDDAPALKHPEARCPGCQSPYRYARNTIQSGRLDFSTGRVAYMACRHPWHDEAMPR